MSFKNVSYHDACMKLACTHKTDAFWIAGDENDQETNKDAASAAFKVSRN